MANTFTTQDTNNISNQPGILRFRKYGTSDSYTTSVFTNGLTFNVTPEIAAQGFDDTGHLYDYVNSETGEISFSYGQVYNLDFFETLGNGLYTVTNTSGGAQAVEDQVIAGGWTDKAPNAIVLLDSAGTMYEADGEPAITSVTASSTGVLAADDDYTIIPDANSKSGYSIVLNTAGTATVATSEDITIVFNSPTVVGQKSMSVGGVTNFGAIEGYIETVNRGGEAVRIDFHRGFFNGNLNYAFAAANNAEAVLTDVTISLQRDTNKSNKISDITVL